MRIIEATWEKRNLGVTCVEMEFGKLDTAMDVERVLADRKEQYQVAKVLAGNTQALFALQAHGFQFIEMLFETVIALDKRPENPPECAKLLKNAGYHIATDAEKEMAVDFIRQGTIFSTDRIALDPAFSKELAGRRYAFWTEDVLSRNNASMVITEYEGKNVGFNILVDKGTYCDGMLGGLFPESLNSGIGFTNVFASLNAAYDMGSGKMISHVSSNNFQMYKLHLLYGMHVRRMTYNLVRHC